eukprot:c13927_g1_i1 orf=524-2356(-)
MHIHNTWGGSFDVSMDSATDDDRSRNLDFDRASLQKLEETQQSWLLGPSEQKKKKYVDLGCMVCSRKVFLAIVIAFSASALLSGLVVLIVKTVPRHHSHAPPEDSYAQALHKVLLFFNAQKSGKLPKHNNISWRGNSALKDGFHEHQNLVGGYYDAGDNIKFGFPGAFMITMLSWSVVEYSAKYEAIGELEHVKELIKWGTDYMLKTFNASAPSISVVWGQVGTGGQSGGTDKNDHYCWERPEDMDYQRQAYSCGQCSDLAAEMAAALAAASIVFKDDRVYSQKLVHGGEVLFDFSRKSRGRYSQSIPDAKLFYNSTGYYDEYVWGGAWMYYATGNSSYLQLITNKGIAKNAGAFSGGPYYGVFDWDNKLAGAQVLLTRLRLLLSPGYPYEDVLRQYNNGTELVMCSYLPAYKTFNRTKGGLIQLNHGNPSPLQYAAASAFLAAIYADYLTIADIPGWNCGPTFYSSKDLRDFSRSQIDYILGHNPLKMSYVVGYGKKYPTHVHHRGASIPRGKSSRGCTTAYKYRNSKSPNPHTLVGALVSGPNSKDQFRDVRMNYNYTEPTLAGNAALSAALIALSGGDSGRVDENTIFSAIPPMYPAAPPPPAAWNP